MFKISREIASIEQRIYHLEINKLTDAMLFEAVNSRINNSFNELKNRICDLERNIGKCTDLEELSDKIKTILRDNKVELVYEYGNLRLKDSENKFCHFMEGPEITKDKTGH